MVPSSKHGITMVLISVKKIFEKKLLMWISYKLKGGATIICFIPVVIVREMPDMPLNLHSTSGIELWLSCIGRWWLNIRSGNHLRWWLRCDWPWLAMACSRLQYKMYECWYWWLLVGPWSLDQVHYLYLPAIGQVLATKLATDFGFHPSKWMCRFIQKFQCGVLNCAKEVSKCWSRSDLKVHIIKS